MLSDKFKSVLKTCVKSNISLQPKNMHMAFKAKYSRASTSSCCLFLINSLCKNNTGFSPQILRSPRLQVVHAMKFIDPCYASLAMTDANVTLLIKDEENRKVAVNQEKARTNTTVCLAQSCKRSLLERSRSKI